MTVASRRALTLLGAMMVNCDRMMKQMGSMSNMDMKPKS